MVSKTLKIDNVKDVYNFVRVCCESTCAYDIYAERGRITTPCTSIMGMFSLDTSQPFTCSYPEEEKSFESYIKQFEIEG